MSVPPGHLPKCKMGSLLCSSNICFTIIALVTGNYVCRLNLSLSHLSGSFTRVGATLPTSSPHLALAGTQLTVPLPHLQVCEWRPPEQLKQLLDLELRDTGEPHQRLLELCQDVIRYSVKTSKNFTDSLDPCSNTFFHFLKPVFTS